MEEINSAYDRQEEKRFIKKARSIEDITDFQQKRLTKVSFISVNNVVIKFKVQAVSKRYKIVK